MSTAGLEMIEVAGSLLRVHCGFTSGSLRSHTGFTFWIHFDSGFTLILDSCRSRWEDYLAAGSVGT